MIREQYKFQLKLNTVNENILHEYCAARNSIKLNIPHLGVLGGQWSNAEEIALWNFDFLYWNARFVWDILVTF